MNKQEFTIKFWGVRGSHPVPGWHTVTYGGNTTSVEIRAGGETIILDAGTGIIPLGKELASEGIKQATLLFTHTHHDHTQGFPFFTPAFMPDVNLNIYGPGTFDHSLEEVLSMTMVPPYFPVALKDMNATINIHEISSLDVLLLGGGLAAPQLRRYDAPPLLGEEEMVKIRSMRSHAHPGGVNLFRIEYAGKVFVFASDTEGYVDTDRRLSTFALNADVLVHDAQYTEAHYLGMQPGLPATQGYGHSTPGMAAKLAKSANVSLLVLTHYDPNYDDATVDGLVMSARAAFPYAIGAQESLSIDMLRLPYVGSLALETLTDATQDLKSDPA